MDKVDIYSLSKEELALRLKEMKEPVYRTVQIFNWLYQKGVNGFAEMSDLPDGLRDRLKSRFHVYRVFILDAKRSSIDETVKYLLKLEDGNTIEAVFLPSTRRNTACLSSQVGCKYACSFCASSPFGFVRNLTSGEILSELLTLNSKHAASRITNIVFMGIGEPMDNYDNVLRAIRVFNDKDAFNIGARKITISTCGIIPGIKRLEKENLQVELSVSLHSAVDSVRSKIVPINRRFPIGDLMEACREYTARTGRVITFEYVLIQGVNSSREDALELVRLLKGMKCKVNTISYNQIKARGYEQPSKREAADFVTVLKGGGINVTHRKSLGEDIDAGCGQLRISRM